MAMGAGDNISNARNTKLLQGFRSLWEEGLLCDTTLETEDGQRYKAHRCVLAAASDYFLAMYTQDMQERLSQGSICLKGVSGEALEVLLVFIYTAKLGLSEDNVVEVVNAAAYLQLEYALVDCFGYLLANGLTSQNCVEVYNATKIHKQSVGNIGEELEEKSLKYICEHFSDVLESGDYQRLDAEAMEHCLTPKMEEDGTFTDHINYGPEIELFQFVAHWAKANHTEKPLRAIRFPLMACTELEKVLSVIEVKGFKCKATVKEAIKYKTSSMPTQLTECVTEQYQVRNRPCVVSLAHDGFYKNLRFFILSSPQGCPPLVEKKQTLSWLQLPLLDQSIHKDLMSGFIPHSWVVIRGFLIVLGQVTKGQLRCYMFDPRTLKWSAMATMNVPRTHCPLVECEGQLLALGGVKQDGRSISSAIEQYNFRTNTWNVVGSMGQPLSGHGACSIGNKIYIFGGQLEDGKVSKATYSYEPTSNTWTTEGLSLPWNNSLRLHSLLARIYGAAPSSGGMTHFQSPDDHALPKEALMTDRERSPQVKRKLLPATSSHFAVLLSDSVFFIGGTLEDGQRGRRSVDSLNVNKCVQVIVNEKQGMSGYSVSQPDYPKGWKPCLAVGLSLPWDIVRQGQPVC